MEYRQAVLRAGACEGLRAAWMALAGEDPELLAVPRAYPREGCAAPSTLRESAHGDARAEAVG
jgi:hypothetical protein